MRRSLVPAGVLMGVLFTWTVAQAASPTEQLRGFFTAAARILDPQASQGPEARLKAIRALLRDIVDVRAAARLSLGPSWSARTSAERDEFVRLFGELLERALIGGIAGRIRLPDGIQVSYVGESVEGAEATVQTTVLSKGGLDLPFTYRMIERAGRWAIRDVVIDGVSVAANYRAQFVRVMRFSSYQELIRLMRARVPEAATSALVATPTAGALAGKSDPPSTLPSDTVRPQPALASPPPDPPAHEVVTDARSDPRLRLELDVTPIDRAPPSVAALPAEATGDGVPIGPEQVAPPREVPVLAAPKEMAARPALSANGKSYWVQVGAFKSLEAAKRLAALLVQPVPSGSGRSAVVTESGPADTPLTRVRVGPFADRWEAAARLREIEAQGYKPFIAAE